MRRLLMFTLTLLLVSCSTTDVEARAEWKIVDEPNADKEWRICSEKYDGAELAKKGFCYRIKECRKRFLRKRECRPLQQFCKYGDDTCYEKYGLFGKTLQ